MGSAKHERMGSLKECSKIMDDSYEVKDVLKSIINDIGNGKILSCVKSSGNWIITLRNKDDADLLIETGHKSFNCPQAGDDNNDHHGNGDPATGRNTISPPKHANVQHTDQPKDEAMDQLSQTKGSAIETNETKKKQNENIKTTQRDEQRPTKPTQEDLRIQKQLEETKRLKPLTPPVTKQRQMNQPWNYLNI
ncbi:hypothetical protein BSL78_15481 [Apostichopus japonicus]|uniref:Uncharacterized protein n=1 Tax=Stichopus japonicus TaxID=307972 RepID=A0A2G8KI21_STIJA|nr:hypothetical protein BSL78_15481 [Apostichopus japonicus]